MPEESDGGTHVFTVAVIGVLVAALAPGVIVVVVVTPVVIRPVVIIVTLLAIRVLVLLVVVIVIASVRGSFKSGGDPIPKMDYWPIEKNTAKDMNMSFLGGCIPLKLYGWYYPEFG